MKYMKDRGLEKMVTVYAPTSYLFSKAIRGVEEKDGSVTVFKRKFMFLWNPNYPWVKTRNCTSMESFIKNNHNW